ncbi:MAG TPA: phosphatase PAP2 family protein [Vicinamibacterales bacterium]|nr:phosphatase PAP2 family protein [Vicinamibacterales bacterium]
MTVSRTLSLWVVVAVMAGAPTSTGLTAASNDAGAGNWQMIVLSGPTQFVVAPPGQTSGFDYQAELTAIKNAQSRLTADQRKAIEYWSRGGVLRWNEILLELVSRFNLPPVPNPDNTYPVPDANNPFSDPQFPFANPPYAARAYSYVSAAQFDALKAAWYFKYLYNRPSPSKIDGGVKALAPTTDLPAYPSEDAVMSGVSAEMLKLLFPAAGEEITRKAAEQRQAALLSGKATASDIAAGLALGQAVATAFVARAGTDGMRTAGGSPALWQALADGATARGEIPWKSMDVPARPPMLPAFGNVRAWMMTQADIVRERPGPPPSTSSALMAREVAEVRQKVDRGTRQELAIANKWADGPSTPTPPGHWNVIAAPYIRKAELSEVRAARAFALLNMALHDAAVGCWETKYFYFNPRPSHMDPDLKSVIGLPNFPSYTSGHSTFSGAAAAVLSYLFPSGAADFEAQKEEASISRLYGGIHYRSDLEIGMAHGERIGGYTISFARTDGADVP